MRSNERHDRIHSANILQRQSYLDKYIRKSAATVYGEAQVSARHVVGTIQSRRVNSHDEVCRSDKCLRL